MYWMDEVPISVGSYPSHGRAKRGQEAEVAIDPYKGKSVSLFVSLSADGMGPCRAVEGSTTWEHVSQYFEHLVMPHIAVSCTAPLRDPGYQVTRGAEQRHDLRLVGVSVRRAP